MYFMHIFRIVASNLATTFVCHYCFHDLQLQLMNLQTDNSLKERFKDAELTEFYASLTKEKFCNLKQLHEKNVLFASTYICEQIFSCMIINNW